MYHDPDSTIRDADIETAELTQFANKAARLKRRGVCLHLWTCEPASGPATCRDCGKTWPSADLLADERRELRIEWL